MHQRTTPRRLTVVALGVLLGCGAVAACLGLTSPRTAVVRAADPRAPEGPGGRPAEEQAIRKTGDAYSAAFNKGDLDALQEAWADDAEYTDEAGQTTRGRQAIGALIQLLVVMKGLPLTYGKDMQEDKQPVFLAVDNLQLSLAAMTGMVRDLSVNAEAMRAACDRSFITATDLADNLVRRLDLPFREAHHIAGSLVRLAEEKGCSLAELPLADMQRLEPRIDETIRGALGVEAAVASRTSHGGTAPDNVRRAAASARERFL